MFSQHPVDLCVVSDKEFGFSKLTNFRNGTKWSLLAGDVCLGSGVTIDPIELVVIAKLHRHLLLVRSEFVSHLRRYFVALCTRFQAPFLWVFISTPCCLLIVHSLCRRCLFFVFYFYIKSSKQSFTSLILRCVSCVADFLAIDIWHTKFISLTKRSLAQYTQRLGNRSFNLYSRYTLLYLRTTCPLCYVSKVQMLWRALAHTYTSTKYIGKKKF